MNLIKTLVASIMLIGGVAIVQAQENDKAVDLNASVVKEKPYYAKYENPHFKKEELFARYLDFWVTQKFNYPKEALDKEIQGTVKVHYLVDRKGNFSVQNVEGEPILAAEGKKIFTNFPQLVPAKDAKGYAIAVQGVYPIEFKMYIAK